MTSPVQSLEDAFQYNSSLARAQLPQFPAMQRPAVAQWLDKLGAVGAGMMGARRVDAMRIRNDYMWFLLLVLRGGRLTEPFRSPPPPGPLPPLHEVLPDRVYEEVLSAAGGPDPIVEKAAAAGATGDGAAGSPGAQLMAKQSTLSLGGMREKPPVKLGPPPPPAFLSQQPLPPKGHPSVRLYMGAFSAQNA